MKALYERPEAQVIIFVSATNIAKSTSLTPIPGENEGPYA